MYTVKVNPELIKELDDLKERDYKSYQNIVKKIENIANILELNPDHCKNLKKPLQDYKRVHINRSYVLVFKVDIKNKEMILIAYDHHKKIYGRRDL